MLEIETLVLQGLFNSNQTSNAVRVTATSTAERSEFGTLSTQLFIAY